MTDAQDSPDVRLIQGAVRLWRRWRKACIAGLAIVAALAVLASGVYTVPTNQTGALFSFGRLVRDDVKAGIHFRWPSPIQQVTIMNTTEVRRLALTDEVVEALAMVTGDENLIEADVAIQYQISDYGRFLIGAEDWSRILRLGVETTLTELVARMQVDRVLTTGKSEIQINLRSRLQETLDAYGAGVAVLSARIVSLNPPREAAASFRRVADARSEANRRVNVAESNRSRALSQARGHAERIVQQARSAREERVQEAQGAAERYGDILAEYRQAREITRRDLYFRHMERVLREARVILFDPDNPIDLNLFGRGQPPATEATIGP